MNMEGEWERVDWDNIPSALEDTMSAVMGEDLDDLDEELFCQVQGSNGAPVPKVSFKEKKTAKQRGKVWGRFRGLRTTRKVKADDKEQRSILRRMKMKLKKVAEGLANTVAEGVKLAIAMVLGLIRKVNALLMLQGCSQVSQK